MCRSTPGSDGQGQSGGTDRQRFPLVAGKLCTASLVTAEHQRNEGEGWGGPVGDLRVHVKSCILARSLT